jgi:hypothetical protein
MRPRLSLARSVAGVTSVEPEAWWRTGFSVRQDWPGGTSESVGARHTRSTAARSLRGAVSYRLLGPTRPACTAVAVSLRDRELRRHRRDYRSPDRSASALPTTDPRGAAW